MQGKQYLQYYTPCVYLIHITWASGMWVQYHISKISHGLCSPFTIQSPFINSTYTLVLIHRWLTPWVWRIRPKTFWQLDNALFFYRFNSSNLRSACDWSKVYRTLSWFVCSYNDNSLIPRSLGGIIYTSALSHGLSFLKGLGMVWQVTLCIILDPIIPLLSDLFFTGLPSY